MPIGDQHCGATLKIIYLDQYFNTPGIAGATKSYELARRLVQRGHEVQMVTTDRSDAGTHPVVLKRSLLLYSMLHEKPHRLKEM